MHVSRWKTLPGVTLLTAFVLLVHGYHPYSEDGGVYVAGIKWLLRPSLYPDGREFVTEHLRFSLFGPLMAAAVRWTGLNLEWMLMLVYLACIWATLYGGWMVLARCTQDPDGRWAGVCLLACWMTLPIAGTSLMLADPYLTARSVSTPATLFAIAGMLDVVSERNRWRGWLIVMVSLTVATLMHPLMAGYALGAVSLVGCVGSQRRSVRIWGTFAVCVGSIGLACVLQILEPHETSAYLRAALTRYYWFPGSWEWYERVGLAAPLLLLAATVWRSKDHGWRVVCLAAMLFGLLSVTVAGLFARPELASHLVARMQPLRGFQVVYLLMILLLGAMCGQFLLRARAWRWAAMLLSFGLVMFYVQRTIYPASAHLELPDTSPKNGWVEAFRWVKENTPERDLFALDAHYITLDGEDAQCFRAIAERSALPDYSKDGGEAAITPELTDAWVRGQSAQMGLSTISDAERVTRLARLRVNWLVVRVNAQTGFDCPYANPIVKVCRMPPF